MPLLSVLVVTLAGESLGKQYLKFSLRGVTKYFINSVACVVPLSLSLPVRAL
jgi:hypothetical protein